MTINGKIFKKTFNFVEITAVVMRRQPRTGIEQTMGITSVGFIGNPYITPGDVSFARGRVEVREENCNNTADGYFFFVNRKVHSSRSRYAKASVLV